MAAIRSGLALASSIDLIKTCPFGHCGHVTPVNSSITTIRASGASGAAVNEVSAALGPKSMAGAVSLHDAKSNVAPRIGSMRFFMDDLEVSATKILHTYR